MGKHQKKRQSSSTPGIAKGQNCQKNATKVRFAKDNRWYRTNPRSYAEAEKMIRDLNK